MLAMIVTMQLLVVPVFGQEPATWTINYVVRMVPARPDASSAPEPMAISGSIDLRGLPNSTSIIFSGSLSLEQNITGTLTVVSDNPPNYYWLNQITTDTPQYVASILASQYYRPYDWRFDKQGSLFRLYPVSRESGGYFYSTGSQTDYSIITDQLNYTTRVATVDVKLIMARATLITFNQTAFYPLLSSISFDTPSAYHLASDSSSALVPVWMNTVQLAGAFTMVLPALPTPRTVDIPFALNLSTRQPGIADVGRALMSTLNTTSSTWLNDDESFFLTALLDDPETIGRIEEGKRDLDKALKSLKAGDVTAFGFSFSNAMKLTAETRQAREDATFFAVYLIAPVVIVFLFVASALVGHLVFNGKPSYIAAIFVGILAVSFVAHPALRIYALSLETDVKTIPSVVITVVLVGATAYMVFKRAGAQTVYGLAISTAMRLTKARRLRGFLSLLAVVVVAASVVPTVTLKTTSPVLTSQTAVTEGHTFSSAFATWSVRIRTSTSDRTLEGLRPLLPGEDSYLADATKLDPWTTLSVSKVSLSVAGGSMTGALIVLDIDRLREITGLPFSQQANNLSDGIFLSADIAIGALESADWVDVNGRQVRVAGLFQPGTVVGPDNRTLTDLLLNVPILTGGFSLRGASTTTVGGPFLGILDRSKATEIGLSMFDLGVIGTAGNASVDDLGSVTMANRDWMTYVDPDAQISIDAVLSYRFGTISGPSLETVYATLPSTVALGSWPSQLLLMVIGGLVVMNVVVNSVIERRKEAITFSSLGASPSFVTNMFIAEGLTLGALGGAIGYALGYAASAWLGVSSPAIRAELYTLTPLVLVLFLSMLTTALGSIFPARSAILQIVPSREILKREVGEIRFDPNGDALIMVPMRIKITEWRKFSTFLRELVSPPTTSYAYGLWIMGHKRVNSIDTLTVDYKAFGGALAERKMTYLVDVRPTSMGEFSGVELKVSGFPEWSDGHKILLKDMLYQLKDDLIKYTAYAATTAKLSPEEEMQDIQEQLARMRKERDELDKNLRQLEWGISDLEARAAKLTKELNGNVQEDAGP
jgi:hypothetical protein